MAETCNCQIINCVNPDDLNSYNLQGKINNTPAPVPPLEPYGSDAVYYAPCLTDEAISVDTALPSWVTIDTANNRLVGAVNTFRGESPAQANARAQAALDLFGGQHATCSACAPAAPDVTIAVGLSNLTVYAYCPTNNTLWGIDAVTDDVVRVNLNDNTFAAIAIPSTISTESLVYGSGQDRIYASYALAANPAPQIAVINPDGTIETTFVSSLTALGPPEPLLAYDSTNDRVCIAERQATGPNNLEIFQCATLAQEYIGGTGTTVRGIAFAENVGVYYLTTVFAAGALQKLVASSHALSTSSFSATGNPIYYAGGLIITRPNPGPLYTNAIDPENSDAVLWTLPTWGTSLNGAIYNPCTDEIQIAKYGTGLVCVNPSTGADIRQVTMGTNDIQGLAYSTQLNQSFSSDDTAMDTVGVS